MPVSGLFPYGLRAWIEPARDAGPLGVRDVLVLEYAPHAPSRATTAVERFYFAKSAGWYHWESSRGAATFDTVGGPLITWHGAGCRDPSCRAKRRPAQLIAYQPRMRQLGFRTSF